MRQDRASDDRDAAIPSLAPSRARLKRAPSAAKRASTRRPKDHGGWRRRFVASLLFDPKSDQKAGWLVAPLWPSPLPYECMYTVEMGGGRLSLPKT